jgi:hypothetical protein
VSQFLVDPRNIPSGGHNPVYAQPLYINSATVTVNSQNVTKNVLIVATLTREVYAFDADDTTTQGGTVLWSRDERNSAAGTKALFHHCDSAAGLGSLVNSPIGTLPFAGIPSTPVVDLSASPPAVYVVSLCHSSFDNGSHWYLDALNLATGATLGETEVKYLTTVSGGPQQTFLPANQLHRPGMLVLHGQAGSNAVTSVAVGFGTSVTESSNQYQGWLFAYDVTNPSNPVQQAYTNPFITECYFNQQVGSNSKPKCTNPENQFNADLPNACGQGGGVWMSARGPAANTNSEMFFAAGNGGFEYCPTCTSCTGATATITDWGETTMKIKMLDVWNTTSGTAPFWARDYFEPYSVPSGSGGSTPYFETLNSKDWDMGVSGVLLFDNTYILNGVPQQKYSMMVTANKRGDAYVLDQSSLGQYQAPDHYLQYFNITNGSNPTCTNLAPADQCDETRSIAYWNGYLVAWPWFETLNSLQWSLPSGASQYTFVANTPVATPFSNGNAGYPGGALAITYSSVVPADPAAVVWAIAAPPANGSVSCNGLATRCPGYLLAYKMSATTGDLTQLWPEPSQTISGGSLFYLSPMATPTAVNGKVYVPAYALADSTGHYMNNGVEVYACASGTGCY